MTSQPWTRVAVIAIDPARPNVVYAGTDRGVGKTTDGGRHWRMVNTGLFDGRAALRPRVASLDESAVWSLTIDAQHPSTVFATTALGLYRTTNGGKRWHIIGPPFFRKAFCAPCAVMRSGYVLSVATRPEPRSDHLRELGARWGVVQSLREHRRRQPLAADHDARAALVVVPRSHRLGRPPRSRPVSSRRVPQHRRRQDVEPFRRARRQDRRVHGGWRKRRDLRDDLRRKVVPDDRRRRQLADGPHRPRLRRDRDRSERPGSQLRRRLGQSPPGSSRASTTGTRGPLPTRASTRR